MLGKRTPMQIGAAALAALVLIFGAGLVFAKYPDIETPLLAKAQFVIWSLAGLSILILAAAELRRQPDAGSWLLALWVWGTFVFTAMINWTVNARSVLPLVPAVAIFVARRMDRFSIRVQSKAICLAAGAALSFIVVGADCNSARAVHELAGKVSTTHKIPAGTLWFQGHWGFQYYMERFGGTPVDFDKSDPKPGDIVAIPSDNTNLRRPNQTTADLIDTITVERPGALDTMGSTIGAGFYSSGWGPLPFAFGRPAPAYALVYQIKQPAVAAPPNPR